MLIEMNNPSIQPAKQPNELSSEWDNSNGAYIESIKCKFQSEWEKSQMHLLTN